MVICIGREFGSGGHEIGKRLAKNLGIPFYDKELVDVAVKNEEGAEDVLIKADEHKANPWLHSVLYTAKDKEMRGLSANDLMFQIQSKVIVELAEKGDCVLIGRCADAVLEKAWIPRVSLFITAPFEERVKRKRQLLELDEKSVVNLVRKMDKSRKAYYDYYTGRNWGKPYNYDFCINSSIGSLEEISGMLTLFVHRMKKKENDNVEEISI